MAIQTGDNRFSTYKWIVDPVSGYGTHTTIQGAIDDASSGDSIFIRSGVYTENFTFTKTLHFQGTNHNNTQIVGNHT